MSKFKARKKNATPVTTDAPAPVVTQPTPAPTPAPVASGRTIVAIAKELKITPQNARRIARKHADALGHAGKGARWLLSAEQEKALRDAIASELKRPAAQSPSFPKACASQGACVLACPIALGSLRDICAYRYRTACQTVRRALACPRRVARAPPSCTSTHCTRCRLSHRSDCTR
jgi:hypothetical protein